MAMTLKQNVSIKRIIVSKTTIFRQLFEIF